MISSMISDNNSSTHAMVYPSTVPKDRLPKSKEELKLTKRKGLVANFRSPAFFVKSENSIRQNEINRDAGNSGTAPTIGSPDISLLTPSTGENEWVQPQEGSHLSIRPHADESALDVGPSDLVGAGVGLSVRGLVRCLVAPSCTCMVLTV